MTRICPWLVDKVSRMLEPDERDAVLGDFTESGVTDGRALWELLGLVLRRQATLWKDWRPWLALVGLVGPVGVHLSQISFRLTQLLAMHVWATWRHGVRIATGLTVADEIVALVCQSLALILWSWTSGFVLGSLSRRTVWVNGALFYVVWLFSAGGPHAGFPLTSHRVVIPMLCQTVLFLLPSVWGVGQGLRLGTLGVRRTILLATAVTTMTALATWTGGWWQTALETWSRGAWHGGAGWQTRLLPLVVVSWPVGYLVAIASSRRWRSKLAAVVLIGSAATSVAQSSPQDYPQWRGRNRDGSASAFSEPKVWPENLTRRWRVDVGEGYATPLVAGDTVYSFTRREGNEVMMALSAANGKILWQTGYPAPYEMAPATRAHGRGPKATPLFHNGKLYTLGISGIVSAFEVSNGKLVWEKPAPPVQPYYGTAVSPVGDKDLVIVHPGNYGPLTAFDANTGDVRWTANGDGTFASPVVVDLGGTRQVVSMTQQSVVGVSVADGTILWRHPWVSRATPSAITPIPYAETIIASGQDMGVTALRPVRRDGKWAAEVMWETKEVSMFLSNPVLVRDTLFGLSHRASGQFFALDAKTGKVLWLGQPRAATNTAVVKAGDLLFFLNDDAELIVARASQTGFELLKRYRVADSATWAQPAISGNRVFVKDVSSLALWTLD